jgi:hypothetical protein
VALPTRSWRSLVVDDVTGLFAFNITVKFDPDFVQVIDADPRPTSPGVQVRVGEFLDTSSIFVVANEVDNERGILQLMVTLTNPAPGQNGSGVLGTILFRGTQMGESRVHVEEVRLFRDAFPELEMIAATQVGGTIAIEGSGYSVFAPRTER